MALLRQIIALPFTARAAKIALSTAILAPFAVGGLGQQSAAASASLTTNISYEEYSEIWVEDDSTSYSSDETQFGEDNDAPAFNDFSHEKPISKSYGPFYMVTGNRAILNGEVDSYSPALFAAMLRDYPALKQIDMVECGGTVDDEANLALARMIRKAGITTFVPAGGSVRSGGVELFLAGAARKADPKAEFAVHSWRDEDGMEADDFAANDPIHADYINFYRDMGMSEDKARAFYNLTNSVEHDRALYLRGTDIASYIKVD
ncbi:hypothetical protein LPB140_05160 [Sphingorhabdus lutea]|uniref:Alpha/beta hydrolase n=1 Tax=Sphingorhabdus lutea TaxID=1913578 RepID=A0A1L3JAX8_9SPHN|nr:hypothetical protein [Sphingorhabdus lutea]APG62295.1 hypothetical protein LPB140_05160 [Sphingorhabdus lutea]